MVLNAPIRQAVHEALETGELKDVADLAQRLGYGSNNTSRIQRMLGEMKGWGGRRRNGTVQKPYVTEHMTYKNAVAVVRAINRDPHEFDL